MGITETEFAKLYSRNTTATRAARNRFGEISAVSLRVKGIRGGKKGAAAQEVVWYTVLIDVEHLRGSSIPTVFVLSPDDRDIRHVNVFPPAACPYLDGRALPHICWGGYVAQWRELEAHRHNRSLVSLVQRLEVVLQHQNFNSCARQPR